MERDSAAQGRWATWSVRTRISPTNLLTGAGMAFANSVERHELILAMPRQRLRALGKRRKVANMAFP
jgi:hypothetical protein